MSRFIEGEDRHQTILFPERLDDYCVGNNFAGRRIVMLPASHVDAHKAFCSSVQHLRSEEVIEGLSVA